MVRRHLIQGEGWANVVMSGISGKSSSASGVRQWVLPAILLAAAWLYLSGLGRTPLRVEAEQRCYEVVREMHGSRDFVLPRLKGELRVQKPPLVYWMSMASVAVRGELTLGAFRFPAVLTALGTLLLVYLWGRELRDPLLGVLGAAFLAVSYLFILHARRGSFEMPLAFFCQAALLAAFAAVTRRSLGLGVVAAAAFGAALLTKGTPALVFVPLPLLLWMIGQRRGRSVFRPQVLGLGLGALGIGFSWYLYLLLFRPESRQTIYATVLLPLGVKVSKDPGAEHFEPFYYFLTSIWGSGFPMSLLLPLAGFMVWKERGFAAASPWRLLLLAFAIPFVVFSLLPQKQDHYLLPALVPMTLLCAQAALWLFRTQPGRSRLWVKLPAWGVSCVFLLLGLTMAAGLHLINDWPWPAAGLFALLTAAACVSVWITLGRGTWKQVLPFLFVAALLPFWSYFAQFKPVEDNFGSGAIFADPAYDAAHWEQKFTSVPYLRKLLDVEKGRQKYNKLVQKRLSVARPVR